MNGVRGFPDGDYGIPTVECGTPGGRYGTQSTPGVSGNGGGSQSGRYGREYGEPAERRELGGRPVTVSGKIPRSAVEMRLSTGCYHDCYRRC